MQRQSHDSGLRDRFRYQPTRTLQSQASTPQRRAVAERPHARKKQAITDISVQQLESQKDVTPLTNPTVPTPSMPRHMAVRQASQPKKRTIQYLRTPSHQHASSNPRATEVQPTVLRGSTISQKSFISNIATFAKSTSRKLYVRLFGDRPLKKPQLAMLSAAGVVFVFGITVSLLGLRTNSHVEAQATNMAQRAVVDDGDNPDEKEPDAKAVSNYTVAPDMPKRITIPKTKTYSRIKPLGTKSDNELKAPSNIYDTGWYQKSAKPGENGAMLINGHVHGPKKPGVFANLKKLVAGDAITIERGDGQRFTYRVVKTQSYPEHAVDMAAALVPAESGKQGLNIITCTGSLNAQKTGYEDRLVVFAVRD